MNAVVWGGGAIGGTVAAYLVRAGHDVTIVDAHAAHVDAIREHGLRIEGPIDTFTVAMPAFLPSEVEGPLRHVMLAVKAQATKAALDDIAPRLADDGWVASLQNGLNEWSIAARVGDRRTVGAFVNFGADVLEPGRIHFGGRGAFVLGELDGRRSERVVALADAIRAFDPGVLVTDDIWAYLWGKMGYGAMLFASALTDETIADVLNADDVRPILRGLAREVLAVAHAEGVRAEGFNGFDPRAFEPDAGEVDDTASFDAMVRFNRASAKARTGVWRDLAIHNRPTEIRAQYGPILAAAERHGVSVPLLRALTRRIEAVEEGRLSRDWETLAGLAADADADRDAAAAR